jgi:DNA-binding NarL/FixJ family response regulator
MRTALGDLAKPGQLTVLEAASAGEAQCLVDGHQGLDLLLLDLHMPGMNGLAGLVEIRRQHPALPIVVVSAADSAKIVRDCIAYGAMGFIHKSCDRSSMTRAVRKVLGGDIHLPDDAVLPANAQDVAADPDEETARRIRSLTRQQLRVLQALAKGQPNKIIAHELGLAEKTVKAHITVILRKLNVSNRTQAVLITKDFLNPGSRVGSP